MTSLRRGLLAVASMIALGCEEPAADPMAGGPVTAAPSVGEASNSSDPRNDYLEPPVNMPTPYRPPRRSDDALPAESGGGGGGGSAQRRARERFVEGLQDVSPAEMSQLIAAARGAARAEAPGEGCERMYASFSPFFERSGEDPLVSHDRFMRQCARIPDELKVCLAAPSERSDAETTRCEQLLGTTDIFGIEEFGEANPPPGRRLTPEQQRQMEEQAARARRAEAEGTR